MVDVQWNMFTRFIIKFYVQRFASSKGIESCNHLLSKTLGKICEWHEATRHAYCWLVHARSGSLNDMKQDMHIVA